MTCSSHLCSGTCSLRLPLSTDDFGDGALGQRFVEVLQLARAVQQRRQAR